MRPANNQLEIHHRILNNVKDNLASFIDPLIKAPEEKKFIGGYVFFLDPRYAERPGENQGTT